MLLVVDVGNTHTVLGLYDDERLVHDFRIETAKGRGVPEWLQLDGEAFKGRVSNLPTREGIVLPITEQLIVELYSK